MGVGAGRRRLDEWGWRLERAERDALLLLNSEGDQTRRPQSYAATGVRLPRRG